VEGLIKPDSDIADTVQRARFFIWPVNRRARRKTIHAFVDTTVTPPAWGEPWITPIRPAGPPRRQTSMSAWSAPTPAGPSAAVDDARSSGAVRGLEHQFDGPARIRAAAATRPRPRRAFQLGTAFRSDGRFQRRHICTVRPRGSGLCSQIGIERFARPQAARSRPTSTVMESRLHSIAPRRFWQRTLVILDEAHELSHRAW